MVTRATLDRVVLMVDHMGINPNRILDLGGDDYLMGQLEIYNFAVVVGLKPGARKEGVTGTFDLITMIDQVEQFPDLRKTIQWALGKLNPDGTFLIEVSGGTQKVTEILDELELPYLLVDQKAVADIFIGERYKDLQTQKVFYSFESPDFDSRETYLRWLGKQYGKQGI